MPEIPLRESMRPLMEKPDLNTGGEGNNENIVTNFPPRTLLRLTHPQTPTAKITTPMEGRGETAESVQPPQDAEGGPKPLAQDIPDWIRGMTVAQVHDVVLNHKEPPSPRAIPAGRAIIGALEHNGIRVEPLNKKWPPSQTGRYINELVQQAHDTLGMPPDDETRAQITAALLEKQRLARAYIDQHLGREMSPQDQTRWQEAQQFFTDQDRQDVSHIIDTLHTQEAQHPTPEATTAPPPPEPSPPPENEPALPQWLENYDYDLEAAFSIPRSRNYHDQESINYIRRELATIEQSGVYIDIFAHDPNDPADSAYVEKVTNEYKERIRNMVGIAGLTLPQISTGLTREIIREKGRLVRDFLFTTNNPDINTDPHDIAEQLLSEEDQQQALRIYQLAEKARRERPRPTPAPAWPEPITAPNPPASEPARPSAEPASHSRPSRQATSPPEPHTPAAETADEEGSPWSDLIPTVEHAEITPTLQQIMEEWAIPDLKLNLIDLAQSKGLTNFRLDPTWYPQDLEQLYADIEAGHLGPEYRPPSREPAPNLHRRKRLNPGRLQESLSQITRQAYEQIPGHIKEAFAKTIGKRLTEARHSLPGHLVRSSKQNPAIDTLNDWTDILDEEIRHDPTLSNTPEELIDPQEPETSTTAAVSVDEGISTETRLIEPDPIDLYPQRPRYSIDKLQAADAPYLISDFKYAQERAVEVISGQIKTLDENIGRLGAALAHRRTLRTVHPLARLTESRQTRELRADIQSAQRDLTHREKQIRQLVAKEMDEKDKSNQDLWITYFKTYYDLEQILKPEKFEEEAGWAALTRGFPEDSTKEDILRQLAFSVDIYETDHDKIRQAVKKRISLHKPAFGAYRALEEGDPSKPKQRGRREAERKLFEASLELEINQIETGTQGEYTLTSADLPSIYIEREQAYLIQERALLARLDEVLTGPFVPTENETRALGAQISRRDQLEAQIEAIEVQTDSTSPISLPSDQLQEVVNRQAEVEHLKSELTILNHELSTQFGDFIPFERLVHQIYPRRRGRFRGDPHVAFRLVHEIGRGRGLMEKVADGSINPDDIPHYYQIFAAAADHLTNFAR